ncbi:alpha/beta hydrolase [Tunturibacter psychrotolerans]|uniref:Alpha/beta hydrolase n=1 Tax=Tunturiibacter psychrotolerans TaxID=3069686 RepID=A0AAU7ZWH5_9BACT
MKFSLLSTLSAALLFSAAATPTPAQTPSATGPTHNVILVHGAWANGASWSKVIPLLEAKGLNVVAVELPLTSLEDDVATVKRAIAIEDGPVLLVGHSYGGVVITEAGNDPKVSGLVYVAAFAPGDNGSINQLSQGGTPPPGIAELRPDAQGFLKLTQKGVSEDFAQDLTAAEKANITATQGPTNAKVLNGTITTAAWHQKPTWYVVSANDRMIPPDAERAMAKAMHAETITLPSSHVAMLSHPAPVAALIEKAAASTGSAK